MSESSSAKLLTKFAVPLDSTSLFKILEITGIMEQRNYISSSGSGEVKRYWRITDIGCQYGVNVETLSPTKTEPRFYDERFKELLVVVAQALTKYIDGLP